MHELTRMNVHTCVNLYEQMRILFVYIRVIRGKKVAKKRPRKCEAFKFIAIVRLLYNVDFDNAFVYLYEVGSVCEVASVDSLVRSSIFDACNNLTE